MCLGSFCSLKENELEVIQPKSLRITGIQKGFIQCFEIYQSIKAENDLDEVSYVFPTDNKLCIYNMKFKVGDETINAELRSKQTAEETFKEAKKMGRTAAMTEQSSPGITSIKIGNVPKDKVVAIILQCAFTSTLQNPNTILTKIPLQASEPDGSLTDLYSLPSLEINLDISINQMCPISDVYTNCESNYEKIDEYNGKLTISSAIITDENILIMTEFSNPVQSQILQTGNSAAISMIPEFESVKSKAKEFVFLIDCSASMIGESIRKAKESLHIFLSKLPDNSFFNIVRFGTTYEKLFPQSIQKTGKTVETAKEFIEKLRANLGGTELLSLFDDLFNEDVKIGSQRQVFLITDGEVYEREKVIQKVEENSSFNRFFAIGLGHGADAGFLDEIAEITHGRSDFVFVKNELPLKVAEHLDLSMIEGATKCEIHMANNDSFQIAPYPLPPLLPHVVSHIFVSSNDPIDGDVLVAGKVAEKDVECVVSLKSNFIIKDGEKSPVFALFAQSQLKNVKDDEEKSVSLSLSSGVLCKYTSYIAVSENSYVNKNETTKVDEDECIKEEEFIESELMSDFEDKECEYSDGICYEECICYSADSGDWESGWKDSAPPFAMYECEMESKRYEKSRKEEEKYEVRRKEEEYRARRKEEEYRARRKEEELRREKEEECRARMHYEEKEMKSSSHYYEYPDIILSSDDSNGNNNDNDNDNDNDKDVEDIKEKVDYSKIWSDNCQVSEILRLQSRDGFWDLPSNFIMSKFGGEIPSVPDLDLFDSPIVKKRVSSTLFTIGFLKKFFSENAGRWKFAKEKGIRWLMKINSAINWEEIINGIIPKIIK